MAVRAYVYGHQPDYITLLAYARGKLEVYILVTFGYHQRAIFIAVHTVAISDIDLIYGADVPSLLVESKFDRTA